MTFLLCYNIMVEIRPLYINKYMQLVYTDIVDFGGKIMSVKWEKKEGNNGVLTFEVSVEEFDKALDKAFKKVVKDIEIPGFRKGRIPRMIFEKRFGVESLRSEERRVGKECKYW